MPTVVITDYAWPDLDIEHEVLDAANLTLSAGEAVPGTAEEIEALVAVSNPVAIMTNWALVSAKAIQTPPNLRIVQRLGVGLDNIAVEAVTARGAWVTNVPDYCVEEVSDHAVGLLLAWARGIADFGAAVKRGEWNPSSARLHRVADMTVGLFGFGRIGRRIAEKLQPFGVRLLASTRSPFDAAGVAVERTGLDDMLAASDVVIVNAPLNPDSHHLFDAARLGRMKRGAFLINVSRGGIIDTPALIAALESGRLAGAGLDVVEGEPEPDRALADRPDVIMTPHIAFSSTASLAELRRRACEEVVRVLNGERPQNPCNTPA